MAVLAAAFAWRSSAPCLISATPSCRAISTKTCDDLKQPFLSLAIPKPESVVAGWNQTPIREEENLEIALELDEAGVISYCQICNAQTFGGVIFHAPLDAAAEIPEALLAHTHVIDHDVLRPFG